MATIPTPNYTPEKNLSGELKNPDVKEVADVMLSIIDYFDLPNALQDDNIMRKVALVADSVQNLQNLIDLESKLGRDTKGNRLEKVFVHLKILDNQRNERERKKELTQASKKALSNKGQIKL